MNPIRSQILTTSVFLLVHTACGSKAEFEGSGQTGIQYKTSTANGAATATSTATASTPESNLTSEPANSDLSTSNTAAQGSSQAQAANPPTTPAPLENQIQKEAEAEAIALPPSIVAGAYLSCYLGVEKDSFVCLVKDASGNARAYPKDKQNAWSFTPNGTTAKIPLIPTVKETTSSGTIFYLSIAAFQAGTINFAGDTQAVAYEISPLFKPDAETVRYAAPVASVNATLIRWDGPSNGSPVFGDGNLAVEKDACLGTTPNANTVSAGQLIVDASGSADYGISSAYFGKVCGLQNSDVYVLVEATGPFKPIKIYLPPESATIKIFGNLDMPHGRYTFTVRSTRMANGSLDDFSIGELSIIPTRKDTSAVFDFQPL